MKYTLKKWFARFGIAGLLFFFIKGLLWLIVPATIAWFGILKV
jgi:hypothetical protein